MIIDLMQTKTEAAMRTPVKTKPDVVCNFTWEWDSLWTMNTTNNIIFVTGGVDNATITSNNDDNVYFYWTTNTFA